MNWEALGAIGEIVGAIGVIITLVYLAIQIRYNSHLIWSQNIHARTQQMQETMALQANPDLVIAIEKAYISRETLEPKDFILLEAYLVSALMPVRDDFLHFEKGLISEEEWIRRKRGFAQYFDANYAKEWWSRAGQDMEPRLRLEINDMIDHLTETNYAGNLMKGMQSDDDA